MYSRIQHKCLNEKHCILHTAAKSVWRRQIWGVALSRGRQTGGVSICHPSYQPSSSSQSSPATLLSSLHEGQRAGCCLSLLSMDTWHQCRELKQIRHPAFQPFFTDIFGTALKWANCQGEGNSAVFTLQNLFTIPYVKKSCIKPFLASEGAVINVIKWCHLASVGFEDYKFKNLEYMGM